MCLHSKNYDLHSAELCVYLSKVYVFTWQLHAT
jgi:hypothetical protein